MNYITDTNRVSTIALYGGDYIAHHGIKGQKWGIRRYQNEDGTLTAAGRKRYGVDLDINDLSRRNIAKIRKGEAYRRLDVARRNNPTNTTRIAELQGRLRSAKRMERTARRIDKGAKLAAKGRTITNAHIRQALMFGATTLASRGLAKHLGKRMSLLASTGRLTPKHSLVASTILAVGAVSMSALAYGYAVKQEANALNLRAYQAAGRTGASTKKYIGSQEYADVVKRRGGQ